MSSLRRKIEWASRNRLSTEEAAMAIVESQCQVCSHWGDRDDVRRNRALRLCELTGKYTSRTDTCTDMKIADPVLRHMVKVLGGRRE